MKKILVEELKPGMLFDKPLYIDNSNMLVAANDPIKEDDIKKLMTWGVVEIETAGEIINKDEFTRNNKSNHESERIIVSEYNDLMKKRKRLIEVHSRARSAIENVQVAIRNNQPFEIDELERSVFEIINLLYDNSSVFLFLYGLEEGKDYLITHSVNVTFYALLTGMALKYDINKLKELGMGTMLIDSGMIRMPLYIVHKQSNLTEQEFKQIKTHPLHGYKALKELGQIKEVIASISLQHHEQFDGNGYPRGLKGDDISEYARIATIADNYEAQISNRSYRKKVDFYHAMRNLLSGGVNKYDPVILRVFLSRMAVYPIGSIVALNENSIGIVIGSIPEKPLRPIVKIVMDSNGNKINETKIVNLLEDSSVFIVKALDENEAGIDIFEVL